MFKDLSGKLGMLAMPEGSLIKKLEKIKKTRENHNGGAASTQLPAAIEQLQEQLNKTPLEMNKRIEELIDSKSEQIKANTEALKGLESQIGKIDQMFASGKKSSEDLKERLDKMDETVLELLSLYEVVSSTVNPFVGKSPVAEKMAQIEKRIEELGAQNSAASPNVIEDIETKFKGLETNIEDLKKTVESKTLDENALVEKVAGIVVDRIKPQVSENPAPVVPTPTNPLSLETFPARQQAVLSSGQVSGNTNENGIMLPSLDNRPETSIILLNWIEFLMEKVGRNNLIDVLEYYVEIGWIGEEVSSRMMAFANGIDYYVERPTWKLLPEDHTKSLLFIEQLRGRKLDKNLFSKLERDVDKIIRSEVLIP